MCQIEAVLNSRPLYPLSSDPSETDCLTPRHFLVRGPLVSTHQYDFAHTSTNRLDRWQLVQQMTQHFWRRWSGEYLHTLQAHSKRLTNKNSLRVGDLVLISEPKTSPLQQPKGRVEALFPGTDGVVRIASIRMKSGVYKRPLVKLGPFPTHE